MLSRKPQRGMGTGNRSAAFGKDWAQGTGMGSGGKTAGTEVAGSTSEAGSNRTSEAGGIGGGCEARTEDAGDCSSTVPAGSTGRG